MALDGTQLPASKAREIGHVIAPDLSQTLAARERNPPRHKPVPRRRPGPSSGTMGKGRCAGPFPPSLLGPGLRRGTSCLAGEGAPTIHAAPSPTTHAAPSGQPENPLSYTQRLCHSRQMLLRAHLLAPPVRHRDALHAAKSRPPRAKTCRRLNSLNIRAHLPHLSPANSMKSRHCPFNQSVERSAAPRPVPVHQRGLR
jgi:hypothetical protein